MTKAFEESRHVVRLDGEFWTFVFGGQTCRLRDTVGLRYLAHLLGRPHEDVSALEIVGAVRHSGAIVDGDRDALERARVNVTRALKGVLTRIELHHPALFQHLRATIRTGAWCSYRPDPRLVTLWSCDDL